MTLTESDPILALEGVASGYGDVPVLRDVSLHVGAGEAVGLAGVNGAGKSTLLRTISGVVSPTAGRIRFDGRDVTGSPPHAMARSGIAHVPEGRGLFPELTVAENLNVGALGVGRTAAMDPVLDVFSHLRSRLSQRAGSLSGGEQQMVAIGRALMASPSLLMVDELSLGLAPKIADELLGALQLLNKREGLALLVVDQNFRALADFSDRVYLVASGRVVKEFTPRELSDSTLRAQEQLLAGITSGAGSTPKSSLDGGTQ